MSGEEEIVIVATFPSLDTVVSFRDPAMVFIAPGVNMVVVALKEAVAVSAELCVKVCN